MKFRQYYTIINEIANYIIELYNLPKIGLSGNGTDTCITTYLDIKQEVILLYYSPNKIYLEIHNKATEPYHKNIAPDYIKYTRKQKLLKINLNIIKDDENYTKI